MVPALASGVKTRATATLLVLLVGCGGEESPAEPPPAPEAPVEEALPTAEPTLAPTHGQARMHDRYDAIEALREAIVRGDFDVARAVARGLDRPVGVGHLPESAYAQRDVVPERAERVARATDEELPARFAELVSGCGECHRAVSVQWRYDDHPPPPDGELAQHMQRHQWAVERMWQALVVADDARFDEGAEALEDAPLVSDDADEENPPGLGAVAESIHVRARDARDAADHAARVQIYGDVLAGCASCHARIEELDAEADAP